MPPRFHNVPSYSVAALSLPLAVWWTERERLATLVAGLLGASFCPSDG